MVLSNEIMPAILDYELLVSLQRHCVLGCDALIHWRRVFLFWLRWYGCKVQAAVQIIKRWSFLQW